MFDKVSECLTNRSDICIEMSLRDFRVTVRLGSEVVHAWVTIIKLSALETCRKAKGHHRVRGVRGCVQVIVGDVHTLFMRSLQKISTCRHAERLAIYRVPVKFFGKLQQEIR